MFKIVPWTEDLDLTEFYTKAAARGFENNSTQKALVNCFDNEREKQVWILYSNESPIGSVAAHSLDTFGPNSYRICARTCTFGEARPSHSLITVNRLINEHQNLTDQFFIPQCIEWAGIDNDLYISSHPSTVGTQKMVHNIYCPTLEKKGLFEKSAEVFYRGHVQTFWKVHTRRFLDDLSKYPRWD